MVSQLKGLVRTMRPRQWIKNGFVIVPLVFDRKIDDLPYILTTAAGFALFCLISSTVYLMNDLVDLKADQAHPTKRNRPLPSGKLSKQVAITAMILFPLIALPLAFLLNLYFGWILSSYLIMQIAYSFKLKHIVLIDVMVIAAGFVLRVGGGVILIDAVRFSPWLYIFTTMLALFLGFGKRRHELVALQENANNHRAILDQYTTQLLDELIVMVMSTTILTYSLYTFSAEGLPENHTMMLTIPFLIYGMFRYLYLIHVEGVGGAPEEIALRDRPLQATVVLFGVLVLFVLYVFN